MNLHNDDDNVNDGDIHDIIIMLAYNLHAHIMAVLGNTHTYALIACINDKPRGDSRLWDGASLVLNCHTRLQ